MINDILSARDFTKEEIVEINGYITSNLPYSAVSNIAPVTEKLIEKCEVYTNVFRFINSAKNYVADEATKKKLERFLNANEKIYTEIYYLLQQYKNNTRNFGVNHIKKKILDTISESNNLIIINSFIDLFLIFIEKQTLVEIDKVAGYNLENEEGRQAYQKLLSEE